jgi:hypothetical protein
LKLSENSDYNCLSGKELANSLPDKLKSMEYKQLYSGLAAAAFFPDPLELLETGGQRFLCPLQGPLQTGPG